MQDEGEVLAAEQQRSEALIVEAECVDGFLNELLDQETLHIGIWKRGGRGQGGGGEGERETKGEGKGGKRGKAV